MPVRLPHLNRLCCPELQAVIKLKLANSTEAELRALQSTLRLAKDDTASDLQRSVFKKYPFFAPCTTRR